MKKDKEKNTYPHNKTRCTFGNLIQENIAKSWGLCLSLFFSNM